MTMPTRAPNPETLEKPRRRRHPAKFKLEIHQPIATPTAAHALNPSLRSDAPKWPGTPAQIPGGTGAQVDRNTQLHHRERLDPGPSGVDPRVSE